MYATQTDRATALRKLDSAVVLERPDSTTNAHAYLRHDMFPYDSEDGLEKGDDGHATPIALDLSIRFGRLAVVSVVAVGLVITLTVIFNRGVVIGHFDPTGTAAAAQKKLLDQYNSYTGNVASALAKPLELFVALAVQVVLLRVATASVLSVDTSWKFTGSVLVLSAGVSFLLNNSLNSLNVQMQPPTIKAVISATDLRYEPDVSTASAATGSTNLTHTFSERTPRNPITNTALRNLVLPRVPVASTQCDWELSQGTMGGQPFPDLLLQYGFAQRDWHSRFLQEALEPKQVSIVVNATRAAGNESVDPKDLPMNASLAADLFAYSMFVSSHVLPWSSYFYFKEAEYMKNKNGSAQAPSTSVARAMGVLPPANMSLDETAQREWFLRESGVALLKKLNGSEDRGGAPNTTRSDIRMEFSRVDISSTVRFDAFTIEFEVDPRGFTDATSKEDNATRYNNVDRQAQCGPWPLRCLMPKPRLVPKNQLDATDPPAQVSVFGSCMNANGTEEVAATVVRDGVFNDIDCDKISTSSLMVVSIGKRFVADSITEGKIVDASGSVADQSNYAVARNLRRIFTYTVAKLSWEVSDLTDEFSATCKEGAGSCQGLRFPLAPAAATPDQKQEIIVGVDALPTDLVTPPTFYFSPRLLPLVKLHEPLPAASFFQELYDGVAGDPLLPHNLGNISWDMQRNFSRVNGCNALPESRLYEIFNNHMYIEHGLQTAYTAAAFFLLQNGVVKDVVELNDKTKRLSLNFQSNEQRVALLASIPDQNARLTLGGCGLLAIGLAFVIVWARKSSTTSKTPTGSSRPGALGHVTRPHAIARVLLDSKQFPPMFLDRRVIGVPKQHEKTGEDDGDAAHSLEGFVIDGLTLQPGTKQNTL